MKTITKATALGVTTALAASFAGVALASKPDPKLASLPKEVQSIHCLAGTWQGAATMDMGGQKSEVKLRMRCEAASSGFGVSCRSSLEGPGIGKVEETDLFGYDPGKRQYHWFAVTSMGETHDHVAELPTSSTIEFVYRGQQEGKPMVEAIKLTLSEDSKHMELRNEGTLDGKPAWTLTGRATKR